MIVSNKNIFTFIYQKRIYLISLAVSDTHLDEKTVTLTVTEQVDADRTWPEKPEDAQNALKAAYVKAGRIDVYKRQL